jgi:hypothetical protein
MEEEEEVTFCNVMLHVLLGAEERCKQISSSRYGVSMMNIEKSTEKTKHGQSVFMGGQRSTGKPFHEMTHTGGNSS